MSSKKGKHDAVPYPSSLKPAEHAAVVQAIKAAEKEAHDLVVRAFRYLKANPLGSQRDNILRGLLMAYFEKCYTFEEEAKTHNKRHDHCDEMRLWTEAAVRSYHLFAIYFRLLPGDEEDTARMEAWTPEEWRTKTKDAAAAFGVECYILGDVGPFNYENYLSSRAQYIAAFEKKLPALTTFPKWLDFL